MSMSILEANPSTAATRTMTKARSAVNWRSVSLGLFGVIFVCALAPYNDYVLNNTYLVGNYLPLGLLMVFLAFIALINAPLWRWMPKHALGPGELSVSLGMLLVGCALPTSGLMRYLPSHLAGIPYHAGSNQEYRTFLEKLDLPSWMFPASTPLKVADRAHDPVIQNYLDKAPAAADTFVEHLRAVPWSAWVRPAVTWGALLVFLYGAVLSMSVLVQKQWAENERLPFPLATIYVSLIEPPERGRAFNGLFRSRAFWVTTILVFVVHGLNGLNRYIPACPRIPIGFDLRAILADPPWAYTEWPLKVATIYFSMVGIAFYMQTKTAFSLWAFYLFLNVAKMGYESRQLTLSGAMSTDQLFGAVTAYGLVTVWIGRHHWQNVLRDMFRRKDATIEQGSSSSMSGWLLLLCLAGVVIWLMYAGATLAGAVVLTLMVMTFFLVGARVVAETGLIFMQLDTRLVRPWVLAANSLPANLAVKTTTSSYFLTCLFYSLFTRDMRESLPVFATHAMRIKDTVTDEPASGGAGRFAFVFALIAALAVAYIAAGASTLYTEYTYSVTADKTQSSPINGEAINDVLLSETMDGAMAYRPPRMGPVEMHSRGGHMAFGAGLTVVLWVLNLRYAAWPLHPVGYLLAFSNPIQQIWFSVFLGWLLKVIIIRIGGVQLFRTARTAAIGLVIGEAGAAAFWLIVSVLCNAMHFEYVPIRLLPS